MRIACTELSKCFSEWTIRYPGRSVKPSGFAITESVTPGPQNTKALAEPITSEFNPCEAATCKRVLLIALVV